MRQPTTTAEEVQRMAAYMESQGVVIDHTDHAHTLAEYLRGDPIPQLIEKAQCKGLKILYVYDMQRQQYNTRADATIWKNCTLDGSGTWYAIGISTQALDLGRDYTAFVALHEITHLLTDCIEDHTPAFHSYLDYVITLYNNANGTHIVNDYCGLSEDLRQPDARQRP